MDHLVVFTMGEGVGMWSLPSWYHCKAQNVFLISLLRENVTGCFYYLTLNLYNLKYKSMRNGIDTAG